MNSWVWIYTLCIFFISSHRIMAASQEKPIANVKVVQVALLVDKLDVFWNNFVRIMNVAANQLKMEVSIYHGHESHLAMIQKAKELVESSQKPDVLMFKSFKGNGKQIMLIAAKHNVKTFAVNAPIALDTDASQQADGLIGELLPDDEQAGYELVKALRDRMRRRNISHVHLIAINGDQADSPAQLRERGLKRAVAEFKDVILYQLVSDAWTAPHADDQFDLLRKRYPMINAVWGGNDTIALSVVGRAKATGLTPGETIFIGGVDASPEGLAAVKNGELVTSVGGHILDGARSLVVLYDYFKFGKLKQKRWITPMRAVTSANVDQYLRVIDPQNAQPLDFTQYSQWLYPKASYDFYFME